MANLTYRTTPLNAADMPSSIPYLVTNEAAERFSYYGMRAILVVFMTEYLLSQEGALDVMGAVSYTHLTLPTILLV